ncbi:type II toxin-antitoxin system VapC family toxin [Sphingomonas sp. CBMAI 2297]|uniref:type II toxin-antitoxin system VapC family toxin n=1 Tax=Sphingomonas sp. CBMAI 2297 TaxID=2991720 RepID=UPI002456DBC0|nr:type II toxin-antitoxin system VapC family toxin [Sphingomonas sp. CBMAI 2297]MDH4743171.1 type II toxin-antitoxin system VapC family toxin [Sphingomonas sp. CBMAI 2297]
MVMFVVDGAEIDLPRNLALIDTNILVALADPDDQHHAYAQQFIDEQDDFQLAVAPPVIGEACSLLIGKRKRRDRAEWLLNWLLSPGSGIRLLPAPHGSPEASVQRYLGADLEWMTRHKLDYVDAYLMQMAHQITSNCTFRPDLVIVTNDMRDFLRCFNGGYRYRVHDVATGDTIDMDA